MEITTKPYSVREMIGQFLAGKAHNTVRNYWNAINRWGGYLHPMEEDSTATSWRLWLTADAHQAKLFITRLQVSGISYSTLNGYRAALLGFYDELIGTGFSMPQGNPFRMVRFPRGSTRPKRKTTALTKDQAALLLSLPDRNHLIGKRDYAILACLLGAGLRRCEVLGLHYDRDIQAQKGRYFITCRNTKRNLFREVEVAGWVYRSLEALGQSGPLFSLSREGLHVLFKRYLRQARLCTKTYSLHSCRKCAITSLRMDGESARDIATTFSGHSSDRMVEYYDEKFIRPTPGPGARLIYGGRYGSSSENVQPSRDKTLRLAWRADDLELEG